MRPFHWQLLGVIFVACYWAAHISLQPYVIKLILDNISEDASVSNVIKPVILYSLISIAFALNFRFYDYVCLQFYPKLKASVIEKATARISDYSYDFYQSQLAGNLANKIKDLSQGTVEIVEIIVDRFFSNILAMLIAFFTLMSIHFMLSLILLTWILLLISISFLATKNVRSLAHKLSESNSHVIGYIVDRFTNILNVRLFASYYHEQRKLKRELYNTVQCDKNLRWHLLKIMAFQALLTTLLVSSCLLFLVFSLNSRHITVGDFGLVLILTISFSDIIWRFAQEISNFSEKYGLVIQGLILLDEKDTIKELPSAKKLYVSKGEIVFEKVFFQYASKEPLFNNKSITIYAGQKVGLVGYSGSGKSTFLHLILGLFDVTSGHIMIDGQDITKVTKNSLYRSVTMIPQDPILFHRTLMENIRYGRTDASDTEIIEAAKKAHAHKFIMSLPQGYSTLVGERGIKLSGGQRQRIAIARAILKNSAILLLDEATSALDSITENLIKDSLSQLMQDKTTIVIAHRLSTLLGMDRILVFDRGMIVEDGTHDELLRRNGMYKTFWSAQADGFIPEDINREWRA